MRILNAVLAQLIRRFMLKEDTMSPHLHPVPLDKAYRLINHGPTVLVSSQDQQTQGVMTAAWACALEFNPAKVTVVLDKSSKTREMIEHSGRFALQVPTLKQIDLVYALGMMSQHDAPEKLRQCGVELFYFKGHTALPVVKDCSAYLLCELILEPHNQQQHDLFIGRVVAAYADQRVFRDGHWYYHEVDASFKSLHHVAGGHFYTIGDAVSVHENP